MAFKRSGVQIRYPPHQQGHPGALLVLILLALSGWWLQPTPGGFTREQYDRIQME
jgi:hypothetical protein